MSKILYQYRYKCTTEDDFVFEWRDEDEGVPPHCHNNSSHSIDTSSIVIVSKRAPNVVQVKEEDILTGGHFQSRSFYLDADADGWTELDIIWEYPISLLDAEFITISSMRGDEVEVVVAPNTVIGAITSAVSSSDTVISVQQSVIDNAEIGFAVNIYDGTNTDNLGYIEAINDDDDEITVSVAATQSFSPSTPTYVRISPMMVRNYTIGHPGRYTLGQGKIGGSRIEAGTTLRIRYHNKHASESKDFYAELDYLY